MASQPFLFDDRATNAKLQPNSSRPFFHPCQNHRCDWRSKRSRKCINTDEKHRQSFSSFPAGAGIEIPESRYQTVVGIMVRQSEWMWVYRRTASVHAMTLLLCSTAVCSLSCCYCCCCYMLWGALKNGKLWCAATLMSCVLRCAASPLLYCATDLSYCCCAPMCCFAIFGVPVCATVHFGFCVLLRYSLCATVLYVSYVCCVSCVCCVPQPVEQTEEKSGTTIHHKTNRFENQLINYSNE